MHHGGSSTFLLFSCVGCLCVCVCVLPRGGSGETGPVICSTLRCRVPPTLTPYSIPSSFATTQLVNRLRLSSRLKIVNATRMTAWMDVQQDNYSKMKHGRRPFGSTVRLSCFFFFKTFILCIHVSNSGLSCGWCPGRCRSRAQAPHLQYSTVQSVQTQTRTLASKKKRTPDLSYACTASIGNQIIGTHWHARRATRPWT